MDAIYAGMRRCVDHALKTALTSRADYQRTARHRRRRHGNGNHRLLLAGNPDALQTIDHDDEQQKNLV